MKIKTTHYIYVISFLISFQEFYAQDLSLKISSSKKNERLILDRVDYQKKHKDSASIYFELNKISSYLKKNGYFTNTLDSIKNENKEYIAYFSLNNKIENVVIKINSNSEFISSILNKKNNIITIPIEILQTTLNKISSNLDKEGKSFSKVQLKNILINDETLFADLDIHQSKKRIINKIIVKEYEDFPKSYIKNYFNIKPNTIFNQHKIKEISNASKNLKFIKEIKTPEVLFTKDSTLLYIYLRKQQNNSFDGIVNFASKEDGGVLFNGNIDLKLNNILNRGEKFELFWNSIDEERQEFRLLTEIPFIFNSKFSPQLSFSIYKQDSTFLSAKFDSKLFYHINPKTKLALTYSSESSKNLEKLLNNNIENFDNTFLGLKFQYSIPTNNSFFNDKIKIVINPSIGRRKTNQNSSNQLKIQTTASYILNLNTRNNLFIRNKTGYLNSNNYIDNELFRIGGINSIRGFNEQSIFTKKYTFFNTEYRYTTSEKSYLYTISDFGIIDTINKNILGLGLGYLFVNKKSIINIALAIGKENNNSFKSNNSKFIIKWINYF